MSAACTIPSELHPLAANALHHWLLGNIGDYAFRRYATLVDSANFTWVTCLIGA